LIDAEFEEWDKDKQFLVRIETKEYVGTQAKVMDMKIALALEECEGISKKKYGECC
jgi:hypothetical protein